MLGEHTHRITPTLLTQAGETEGFQHSNPDFWGLQAPVPFLPYFASYCIRTFGFPTSYFSDVTRKISTHDSHDKGASWWGQWEHSQIAGNVLRQKRGPFQQRRRAGRTDRATGTGTSARKSTVRLQNHLCFCGPWKADGGLGTVLEHPGPHGGPCRQRHRGGHAGAMAWSHGWDPPPGRMPTAAHARATEHETCSGREEGVSEPW